MDRNAEVQRMERNVSRWDEGRWGRNVSVDTAEDLLANRLAIVDWAFEVVWAGLVGLISLWQQKRNSWDKVIKEAPCKQVSALTRRAWAPHPRNYPALTYQLPRKPKKNARKRGDDLMAPRNKWPFLTRYLIFLSDKIKVVHYDSHSHPLHCSNYLWPEPLNSLPDLASSCSPIVGFLLLVLPFLWLLFLCLSLDLARWAAFLLLRHLRLDTKSHQLSLSTPSPTWEI